MTDSLIIGADNEVILHFDLKLEDGSAADSTRVNNKPAKKHLLKGHFVIALFPCSITCSIL